MATLTSILPGNIGIYGLPNWNKCGIIQWEKSFGGTGYESARDFVQTSDGDD
ncbi:MAG TPA: hypothetical protein VFD56_11070 [Chitinophagaceae bacterium]|nr:hypothetical protein [Chitinophagaceae bacterium]